MREMTGDRAPGPDVEALLELFDSKDVAVAVPLLSPGLGSRLTQREPRAPSAIISTATYRMTSNPT